MRVLKVLVPLFALVLALAAPGQASAHGQQTGYIEICKDADGTGVTGSFTFTFGATGSVTVPVGSCSAPIQVPAGNLTITETARAGFELTGVTASPAGRLVSTNLAARSATVQVVAGGVSTETVVRFRNRAIPTGELKICKIAGTGVAAGTDFSFTVTGRTGSTTVPAGTGGGNCVFVPGTFPVGTVVTVTEAAQAGTEVSAITVSDNRGGTPNLANRTVNVTIGTGVTVVTYTNRGAGQGPGHQCPCPPPPVCPPVTVTIKKTFGVGIGVGTFLAPSEGRMVRLSGHAGVNRIVLTVNGKSFMLHTKTSATRTVSIAKAINEGRQTKISVKAFGRPNSKVRVVVT